MGTSSVDLAAVRAAAQRIAAAAAVLEAPGSWHVDSAALRAELERLTTDLAAWGYAAGELAAALRSGADGHAATESEAAAVLR